MSPLAKKTILLAVISASSLLEVCFFTTPVFCAQSITEGKKRSFPGNVKTRCLWQRAFLLTMGMSIERKETIPNAQ